MFGEGSAGFVKHHLHGVERGDGGLLGQDEGGIIMGKNMDERTSAGNSGNGSGHGNVTPAVGINEEVKKD